MQVRARIRVWVNLGLALWVRDHRGWVNAYLLGIGFLSSQTHKNSHRDLGGRK